MKNTPVPFWEKSYLEDDLTSFSPSPNKTLTEYEHLLDRQAAILEVGCGEGQNALYLAEQGYSNIDAFDISSAGIAKLKQRCEVGHLTVNAFTADLSDFRFSADYDLVMSFATLCFVKEDVWKRFLQNAKAHTNPGGIHIIQTFTDAVPPSPDIAPFAVGLAKDGELNELYTDWEILFFQSYTFEDEHPGVPKHIHAANKIVARKNH